MQLHLNQMSRSRLIALLWEKTSGRYRRAMECGRVEIVGVFRSRHTGNEYLAVRIKARRSLWLRVHEVRKPGGRYEILVLPGQAPEWADWQEQLYEGDNMRAYRRCRSFAQRLRVAAIVALMLFLPLVYGCDCLISAAVRGEENVEAMLKHPAKPLESTQP
jgi:hypothetical protein